MPSGKRMFAPEDTKSPALCTIPDRKNASSFRSAQLFMNNFITFANNLVSTVSDRCESISTRAWKSPSDTFIPAIAQSGKIRFSIGVTRMMRQSACQGSSSNLTYSLNTALSLPSRICMNMPAPCISRSVTPESRLFRFDVSIILMSGRAGSFF